MSNNYSLPGFRPAPALFLCLCLSLSLTARAAIPWSKQFDPDLTVMEDPTIKQLYSDDFSRGFILTGVSDIPGFSTGQSTAIGAQFEPDGTLLWGAFLDAGFGSPVSRERVVPLEDTTNLFAAYVVGEKARIGVYSGGTLAKRFGYEFDLRPTSEFVPQVVLGLYGGDVIGVAQHLGNNNTINVMLFDPEGNKLSDKDYSGFMDPGFGGTLVMLHRLPDQSGFLLITRQYLLCLHNDGTVRWAKSGFGDDRPLSIAPDGSMLFTAAVAAVPGFPDGGTFMLKFNSDGSLAWARVINAFVPVTDLFVLGRNPVYDGTNIWMTGGTPDPNSPNGVGLDGSYIGLMRLDGATGDIIAQADLSFEDRNVYLGEFAAWTGSHVLFAIESTDPFTVRRGHLLKMDGNFANPELHAIRADHVETTRVSHDAASGSLLYTWSAFNGSVIHAVSMDAATLMPALDCDLIGPVPFQFTNSMRTTTTPAGTPPFADAAITVNEANTLLTAADLPVVAMTLNEFDLCSGNPQPPAPPVLRLAYVSPGGTLNLTFPSETSVNYEILFTDSMSDAFELIETLSGTGGELTYPVDAGASAGGYYLVRATRESE